MIRSIISVLSTNLLIQAFSIGTGVLVARLLGPTGRGELAIILLWPTVLAGVLLLGTDVSVARLAAAKDASRRRLQRLATSLTAVLGSIALLAGYLAMPWLLGGKNVHLLALARYGLLAAPFSMLNVLIFSIELGAGRFRGFNRARLVFSPIYAALLVGSAWMFAPSVSAATAAFVVATITTALASMLMNRDRHIAGHGETAALRMLHILRDSRWMALATVASMIAAQVPLYILSRIVAASDVGNYVVAFTVASAGSALGVATGKVMFSRVAAQAHENDTSDIPKRMRGIVFVNLVFATGLMLCAPLVVFFLFGSAFAPAVGMSILLVPVATLTALALNFDETLRALGKPGPGLMARVLTIVILATTAPMFIIWIGLIGLPIAMGIAAISEFSILVYSLARRVGTSIWLMAVPSRDDVVDAYTAVAQLARRQVRIR